LEDAEVEHNKMKSNPKMGQTHPRAPSRIFWRTVRGMLPHKSARGAAALDRFKAFEGMPHSYERKKCMVIPTCSKALGLRPHRQLCKLGDFSKKMGWKQNKDLVETLESKHKCLVEILTQSQRKVTSGTHQLKKKLAKKL